MDKIRTPAVAGYFYPSERSDLLHEIEESFQNRKIGPGVVFPPKSSLKTVRDESGSKSSAECFVVPHAGYTYSGPVAAHSYLKAYEFLTQGSKSIIAFILGPNHYGIGSGVALSPSLEWQTPLGKTPVNQEFSKRIAEKCDVIDSDGLAHSREHSIEVQVPFLQFIVKSSSLSIIPICMMLQDRETAEEVADAVFDVLQEQKNKNEGEKFLVIASSDLTHYEPQSIVSAKDQQLLEKISKLDLPSYYTTLERNDITACGYGPIAVAMSISKKLGRSRGDILKHATSGDTTGDTSSVVGYSAVHFV